MQYQELLQKRDAYQKGRDSIPESVLARFEREFEIQYIYESNALEGNSLTLEETKAVLRAAEEGKDIAFCVELLESMRRKKEEK